MDNNHWGNCNDTIYDVNNCEEKCIIKNVIRKCSCLPYEYLKNKHSGYKYCEEKEEKTCMAKTIDNITDCNCFLPCKRNNYDIINRSYLKLLNNSNNYIKIKLRFYKNLWIFEEQNQRFRTVDVLSFVGGSMGLFLGMSCITLMEVFMFLFKSIWGIVNNQRHKNYLSNLLGESMEGLLSNNNNYSSSHEEIVITQTNQKYVFIE